MLIWIRFVRTLNYNMTYLTNRLLEKMEKTIEKFEKEDGFKTSALSLSLKLYNPYLFIRNLNLSISN